MHGEVQGQMGFPSFYSTVRQLNFQLARPGVPWDTLKKPALKVSATAIWGSELMNSEIILTLTKAALVDQAIRRIQLPCEAQATYFQDTTTLLVRPGLINAPWNLPTLDCPKNYGNCGTGETRPESSYYYRQVRITITPVGSTYHVKVEMNFSESDPNWITLISPFTLESTAPATLKLGFAASTGGLTNYHEIRNLNVSQQLADITATKSVQNITTGGGSVSPGEQLLYTAILKNNTNTAVTNVSFTDPIPENTDYIANSLTIPSGSTVISTSPISISGINIPANGQATIRFKVEVNNPIYIGVTTISNQGSFGYNNGSITSKTDGDLIAEGNQATYDCCNSWTKFRYINENSNI